MDKYTTNNVDINDIDYDETEIPVKKRRDNHSKKALRLEQAEVELLRKQLTTTKILTVFVIVVFILVLIAGGLFVNKLNRSLNELTVAIDNSKNTMASIDTTMKDAQETMVNVNIAIEEARVAIADMETAVTDLDAFIASSSEVVDQINQIDFDALNEAITNLTTSVNGFSNFTSMFSH